MSVREREGVMVCQRNLNWKCCLLSLWKWCLWVKDLDVLTQGFNSSGTIQEEPWNQICFLLKATKKAMPRVSTVTVYRHGKHIFYFIVDRGEQWVTSTSYFFLWLLMNKKMSGGLIQIISPSLSHIHIFYILYCFVVTRLLSFVVISTFLWSMRLILGCKTWFSLL